MKKFLVLLLFLVAFSFSTSAQVQTYNRVDVFDNAGFNTTDFVFSYDVQNQCMNNFIVYNNLRAHMSFRFNIYLNNVLIYKGRVNLTPGGYVVFNDAFYHCASSQGIIRVVTM